MGPNPLLINIPWVLTRKWRVKKQINLPKKPIFPKPNKTCFPKTKAEEKVQFSQKNGEHFGGFKIFFWGAGTLVRGERGEEGAEFG